MELLPQGMDREISHATPRLATLKLPEDNQMSDMLQLVVGIGKGSLLARNAHPSYPTSFSSFETCWLESW